MAQPIIDSIVATPDTVLPGGAFTVAIVAHDPDARVVQLMGSATDAGGSATQAQVTVTISDPITYALDDGGSGFTITPKAGQPGVFDVVAP